jgi:hypothetical protein
VTTGIAGGPVDTPTLVASLRATAGLLQAVAAAAFARPGLSGHFGPVTLGTYATHVADHDREHLAQMRECRCAAGVQSAS